MSAIRIEPLQVARFRAHWDALDAVARERQWLIFLQAPPFESSCEYLHTMLGQHGIMLHALDGDRLVGWCDVRKHDAPPMAHCGTLGMGIIEGYRGQGLGKRLLGATLNAIVASDLGIERIELSVWRSNTRAQALYRSFGFVEEGCKIDAGRIDGVSRDMLLMAKCSPKGPV